MRGRTNQRGLIALNIALVAGLAIVSLAPVAGGQPGSGRSRGDYTMIGGRIQGSSTNAIYVVDAANSELVALKWSQGQKRFEGVGYRDLNRDARNTSNGR